MSDDILTPQNKGEMYLATLTGDYDGPLPDPTSRFELYMAKLIEQGGASEEELRHLAELIQENTEDISDLETAVNKLNDHSDDPYGTAIYRLARPDYLNGSEYIDTGVKLYDDVTKDWTFVIKYKGTVISPQGLPYMLFSCKHDGIMDGATMRYWRADDDPSLSDSDRGIDCNLGSGGFAFNEPDSTGVVTRGETNIIIIVKSGNNYSVYCNRNTMAYGGPLGYGIDPSLAHDLTLIIGARHSYDGTEIQYKTKMVVEDARVYGTALSDAQCKLLYEELAAM